MVNLAILTGDDVESIHRATLRILSHVGIALSHPEAREILIAAGCTASGGRVFVPPVLVQWALDHCPSQVVILGRDGRTVTLGDGTLHWHNLGGARDVYDARSGDHRPAGTQDVCDAARLLDALDVVATVTPLFTPQDVPAKTLSLAMYRHTLANTTKPVQGPGVHCAAEVRAIAEMAAVIGPPEETLTLAVSPVSPLGFPDPVAEAIVETARQDVPLGPLPCPTAGATSPMSLAGSLAQQNAEILATVVLAQLVRPGLPIVYCGRLAMMEPRTGRSVWGGVETGLAAAACVQIGHHYRLPVNVYGMATDAHVPDFQSGFERALNAAVPALAGADELSGIGEMSGGVLSSWAQVVCDSEIAASILSLRQGCVVDEETLGLDVVAAVIDGPGNFLGERHTVRHLRARPRAQLRLAERCSREEWAAARHIGMAGRAQVEAERLLREHVVQPLAPEQEHELDDILALFAAG